MRAEETDTEENEESFGIKKNCSSAPATIQLFSNKPTNKAHRTIHACFISFVCKQTSI